MPSRAIPLTPNAVLALSGDDAADFLHGQFTNDVKALTVGAAQWNGWCSAKGRLLATFLLLRRPGGYLLMLPAEIAAPFAKRLRMFVLRSKVTIEDVTATWQRVGVVGPDSIGAAFGSVPAAMTSVERDGAYAVALDERRFVVLAPEGHATLASLGEAGTLPEWDLELIHLGVPVIVAATQEAFVPQMANFELVGGVSFKKGCYPGQEIVARTQYRGILKKRMALAHVDGAVPAPGQDVYGAAFGDQSAGAVVNAAPAPGGGHDLLVVAQLECLAAGDLKLGAPDGPALRIVSHPAAQAA